MISTRFAQFLAAITGFIILSWQVVTQGVLTSWNEPLLHFFRGLRGDLLDPVAHFITLAGDDEVQLVVILCLSAWLVFHRRWNTLTHWVIHCSLTFFLVLSLKAYFHYPRPPGFATFLGYTSFPSGHSTRSVAIYGLFAFLYASHCPPQQRKWIFWPIGSLVGLILFTRVYLGAHWITDVIGGLLLGTALVGLTMASYQRKSHKPLPLKQMLWVFVIALTIGWTFLFFHKYDKQVKKYTPHWPNTQISQPTPTKS